MAKLREIRHNQVHPTTDSRKNLRENLIEKHMSNGLSRNEAIEYEEKQTRMNQLQAKMSKQAELSKKQYHVLKSYQYA